jgi:hypothetical protein
MSDVVGQSANWPPMTSTPVRFPTGTGVFFLFPKSPLSGAIRASLPMSTTVFFMRLKEQKRDADHSPLFSA